MYGPSLFRRVMLENVPSTSTYVLGINFKTLNVSIALDIVQAAWDAFISHGQQSRLRMTVGMSRTNGAGPRSLTSDSSS